MGILSRRRERRRELLIRENNEYKQSILNERLKEVLDNDPVLNENFQENIHATNERLKNLLEKEEAGIHGRYETLTNEKLQHVRDRFDRVNDGLTQTGDFFLTPFRMVEGTVESIQDTAFNIVDGFTSIFTSPLTLIIIGGAVYFVFFRKNENE